jgi:hypothetical protein
MPRFLRAVTRRFPREDRQPRRVMTENGCMVPADTFEKPGIQKTALIVRES